LAEASVLMEDLGGGGERLLISDSIGLEGSPSVLTQLVGQLVAEDGHRRADPSGDVGTEGGAWKTTRGERPPITKPGDGLEIARLRGD